MKRPAPRAVSAHRSASAGWPVPRRNAARPRISVEPRSDRLLHNFRVNVGLPTDAKPFGGWESPTGELRGHSLGHYLSALSLMYASTGDAQFKQRADHIVGELAKCQGNSPAAGFHEGYLSAVPGIVH